MLLTWDLKSNIAEEFPTLSLGASIYPPVGVTDLFVINFQAFFPPLLSPVGTIYLGGRGVMRVYINFNSIKEKKNNNIFSLIGINLVLYSNERLFI